MRYEKGRKDATRAHIIDVASAQFRELGVAAAGLAGIMTAAGLTNGAFYAHFESKDDLVATVVGDQLGRQASQFRELPGGRRGLEAFVREYLSPAHRDHPDAGCPSAALLDEVGRCTGATKRAYTAGAKAILDEICTRLAPGDPESARGTALALFTMLVGSMQLARALSDKKLSDAVLEEGTRSAEALIRAEAKHK